ncbi:MAG: hypothetical protein KGM97_09340 [Alphaproteobacteria bacterium]|nr:hypothetical protein [Alphaproteobacteria bacterium]MDE2631178.1 hypothetical protein [Alphaproteobacteria bacterium]
MKDVEKFFRYLWRFNAVAMAVIGLGVIVAFAGFLLSALWSAPRSDRAGTFVAVPKSARHGYTYGLGNDAFRLAGTSEEVFVLERWKGDDSPSGARNVNLLVVNGDTAASHWLFRGNAQLILSRDEVHASDIANYNALSPVTALVLTVADAGTDGAAKDRESLYYYRVGGGDAVRFFTADRILAGRQAGADKYLVIYQDGGAAAAGLFSTYDFRLLAKKPVPQIPE